MHTNGQLPGGERVGSEQDVYKRQVDSRMEIYRETYETMEPGTFSPRIFALEKKIFRHE